MEPFDLRLWRASITADSVIDQVVIDSRRIESKRALFVALRGKERDGHEFVQEAVLRGAKFILVSKGYSPSFDLGETVLLECEDPLRALQGIAAVYRSERKAKILAITGSKGKTMAKDLLFAMMGKKAFASIESFNSQLGVALSLLEIPDDAEVAIIEAGISEVGDMSRLIEMIHPDFALLTHLGKEHVATLGHVKTIADQKALLLKAVPESGWALLPTHPLLNEHFDEVKSTIYFWDREGGLPHASYSDEDKTLYSIHYADQSRWSGNIHNPTPYFLDLINPCIKAAELLKIDRQRVQDVLASYFPEPMETEIWTSPWGATFINSAYCADPLSVKMALYNLLNIPSHGRRIYLFKGLRDGATRRKADFYQIAHCIKSTQVDQLLLIGAQPYLTQALKALGSTMQIDQFQTETEAIAHVRSTMRKDDTILMQGPFKEPLDEFANSFHEVIGETRLTINLSAVKQNVEAIHTHLGKKTRIMAIVKANAYGTDSVIMTKFLMRHGIELFGVAHVDEAITLRRQGVTADIFVINAALYEIKKIINWGFQIGVSNLATIQLLDQAITSSSIKVHLHVDTGMSRFGCRPEDVELLAKAIHNAKGLVFEGIMTHFACAESEIEDQFTLSQIEKFSKMIESLESQGLCPPWRHASNTSGTLRHLLPQLNMVRIGIGLFGLYPSETLQRHLPLRPAISLTSRIAGINVCKKGETISYGRTYRVQKEKELIGIVPIGYFDGLHRHYSNKGHVVVRGKRAPMVGTICMDYMMIDISSIPDAAIGDSVLIFGEDRMGQTLAAEEFAQSGGTHCHELITCLGPRIQRIFVHDER